MNQTDAYGLMVNKLGLTSDSTAGRVAKMAVREIVGNFYKWGYHVESYLSGEDYEKQVCADRAFIRTKKKGEK